MGSDPISVIQSLQQKANIIDVDLSSNPELQQTIYMLMQNNAKESELMAALKRTASMQRITNKAQSKNKIVQAYKENTTKLGNTISKASESALNPMFRTMFIDEWGRPVNEDGTPMTISQGAAKATQQVKTTAKKVSSAAATRLSKQTTSVSSREEQNVSQITNLNQASLEEFNEKSESDINRTQITMSNALAELADTKPASTLEGAMAQNTNSLKAFSSGLMVSLKGFTASLFGKEGYLRKFWDSDTRKKATDKLKEKLFTGEDAIFKDQYEGAKAGLKDIKDKTLGYLGKGYDFLYDNTMQYMYGEKDKDGKDISYKESERWKENTILSQKLNREWRAEQKKSAVADIAPKEVKESTEKIKVAVSNAADGVAESAEKLEESVNVLNEVTVGDTSKSPEAKKKAYSSEFAKKLKATMPKALAGVVAGAGVGLLNNQFSLLGSMFLPGGPVAGAIVGGGLSILSQTEAFKSFMFGKLSDPNDPNSSREGGLINEKMRAKFKSMIPYAVGGGVLGAVKGLAKGALGFDGGLGVLGMQILPGGILGGALLGAGIGILKNSEGFKKMLFGEKDENGNRSGTMLSNSFNKFKGGFSKIMPGLKKAGTGLGIGALTGAVLSNMGYLPAMLSLGGPVGMGIAGLGIGIASSTKKFNEWMFGTEELDKDGNPTGNRRKDGLLTRTTNLLRLNVIEPIGDAFKSKMLDLVDWTTEKITYPFRLAFGPIMDSLLGIKDNVVDFVKDKFEALGNGIMSMMKNTMKTLFSPVTKVIGFVGKSLIGIASTGAKLAMSPISAGLQVKQLLTDGKRRKEYVEFYKQYYSKGNLNNKLKEKWELDEANGNKRNIFQKMSDTVGTYLGQGEIAENAKLGWNEAHAEEGEDHLKWREVGGERRQLRAKRAERQASEKQWKSIDKLRGKVGRELGGRELTLNDSSVKEYRKKFSKYGIDEKYLQTSDDIMELIYHRDKFRERINPNKEASGGVVIQETPEQKAAREATEKWQNDIISEFRSFANEVLNRGQVTSIEEDYKKSKKRLRNRLNKNGLKGIKLNDPELQDFELDELTSDMLDDFKYSEFGEKKDLIGFMKAYKVTQRSKVENIADSVENTPTTGKKESAIDILSKMNDKIGDLVNVNKEQAQLAGAQFELEANGEVNANDVKKRKGKPFGARRKKINKLKS